jgi:4'-phosphopantetheinyl transferase EntD
MSIIEVEGGGQLAGFRDRGPYGNMRALSKSPKLNPGVSCAVRALFPANVAVAETWDPAQPFPLPEAEHAYVAGAHPKRRAEFAAGRHCARAAMAALGLHPQALLRDAKGAPCWPEPVVGSVTHTAGYAAAAVGRHYDYAGVGLDAVCAGDLDAEQWRLVLTARETAWLHAQPASHHATHAAVMVSAKEAFFKCQYAVTSAWLDFKAIEVGISPTGVMLGYVAVPAAVQNLPPPTCTCLVAGNMVLTGVWIVQAR